MKTQHLQAVFAVWACLSCGGNETPKADAPDADNQVPHDASPGGDVDAGRLEPIRPPPTVSDRCEEACTAPGNGDRHNPCLDHGEEESCLARCLDFTSELDADCAECVVATIEWSIDCESGDCDCRLGDPAFDLCPIECEGGSLGLRCTDGVECGESMDCVSSFALERRVCTMRCDSRGVCPRGTVCTPVPDLDGKEVGPYCMRPCLEQSDCDDYGSVCDAPLGAPVSLCY